MYSCCCKAAVVSLVCDIPAGNGLIIANGPAEVNFTLDQLREQWLTLHMRIFLGAMAATLVALHAGVLYVKKLEKVHSDIVSHGDGTRMALFKHVLRLIEWLCLRCWLLTYRA